MKTEALLASIFLTISCCSLACSPNDGESHGDSDRQSAPKEASKPQTRQEFASALSGVGGMREDEVIRILGKPDDVRTHYDPGGIAMVDTREIWCYGTDGHLTFPTLGRVYIDEAGSAQYVYGGEGKPPDLSTFTEAELRVLLRLIDRAPELTGDNYDPLTIIQIVNRLQSLGKEKALAAIQEYLRVASRLDSYAREGLFLVLRVLFDVPDDPGYMPGMFVGAPSPPEPKDPKLLPRFPIVMVDDIPLMLVSGYMLGGEAQLVEKHVEYFRDHGRFLAAPLSPTHRPLAVLQKLRQSPQWLHGRDYETRYSQGWSYINKKRELEDGQLMLRNQLLRLVSSVHRIEPDPCPFANPLSPCGDEDRWPVITEEFSRLDVAWNGVQCKYAFADGSSLPDEPAVYYRRCIWTPIPGMKASVILERDDPRFVTITLKQSWTADSSLKPATIRVWDMARTERPIAEFTLRLPNEPLEKLVRKGLPAKTAYHGWRSTGRTAKLAEGTEVQVELSFGDDSISSPVCVP